MKGRAGEMGAEGGEVTRKEVGEPEGHGGDCGSIGTERGGLPAPNQRTKLELDMEHENPMEA